MIFIKYILFKIIEILNAINYMEMLYEMCQITRIKAGKISLF